MPDLPEKLLELCKLVAAKRPKIVIDHILKHGFVTTEELKNIYGYNHPPRAARDVREQGILLETFRVVGSDGRKIAAYRFDVSKSLGIRKLFGRTALTKKFKKELIGKYGSRCNIYLEDVEEGELQIDHRIPYEVGGEGEGDFLDPGEFMLLCGSANRAKSWSCEHCRNWKEIKDANICRTCYWAYPESYQHVAMQEIRRMDIIWQGKNVEDYDKIKKHAADMKMELPQFVKRVLKDTLSGEKR